VLLTYSRIYIEINFILTFSLLYLVLCVWIFIFCHWYIFWGNKLTLPFLFPVGTRPYKRKELSSADGFLLGRSCIQLWWNWLDAISIPLLAIWSTWPAKSENCGIRSRKSPERCFCNVLSYYGLFMLKFLYHDDSWVCKCPLLNYVSIVN
jgi:hypothetical protein